jgi:hypothetical protein
MTDEKRIQVGDIVFLRCLESRRKNTITEVPVTKVGSKYYTVLLHGQEHQFHKGSMYEKTNYSPSYKLYPSLQALNESVEKAQLVLELRRFNRWEKLNLDDLRQVCLIIGKTSSQEDG